jgi:hypothetical protein
MTGPLSALGRAWDRMNDAAASWQAELLRRAAGDMADALDRAARIDIEGGRDWRDLTETRNGRYRS